MCLKGLGEMTERERERETQRERERESRVSYTYLRARRVSFPGETSEEARARESEQEHLLRWVEKESVRERERGRECAPN